MRTPTDASKLRKVCQRTVCTHSPSQTGATLPQQLLSCLEIGSRLRCDEIISKAVPGIIFAVLACHPLFLVPEYNNPFWSCPRSSLSIVRIGTLDIDKAEYRLICRAHSPCHGPSSTSKVRSESGAASRFLQIGATSTTIALMLLVREYS